MHKPLILLFTCYSLFSLELRAQNLKLKIEGASLNETEIITSLDYQKNHVDYQSITIEVDSLQEKIIKLGYIENERSSIKKINDSVIRCNFKLNTKFEKINIYYEASKVNRKIIESITNESFDNFFSIPFIDIERVLKLINTQITNEGFPFTKVRLSEIKKIDKKTLSANLLITERNVKRGLDKIVLKGYEAFPKSYLKRFLKIEPTKTFNIENIKNKITALDNLRFAKQIKSPEVLFSKDTTTLYLYLEKKISNSFDGFLGFSTNEETNKLNLNGYLDLELNNNLNYGESFTLLYKSNENEEKTFEAKLNLPYIFGSVIGSELELNIFKKDSSFTTINQKAKLFYQINTKNKIYLGIDNTQSSNLLNELNSVNINDYNANFYTSRYEYEDLSKINTLFKVKTAAQIEIGFGNRKNNLTNTRQLKLSLNIHHIFNLNNKNSIFLRINALQINADNYIENELIRFGGIKSIRGFIENSLLATSYATFNSEYRYQLSKNIYAHTIIDYAALKNKITSQNERLYGFGFGFGINTKSGLLKFNFANGKKTNQPLNFINSQIHVSLTRFF